MINELWANLSY